MYVPVDFHTHKYTFLCPARCAAPQVTPPVVKALVAEQVALTMKGAVTAED